MFFSRKKLERGECRRGERKRSGEREGRKEREERRERGNERQRGGGEETRERSVGRGERRGVG